VRRIALAVLVLAWCATNAATPLGRAFQASSTTVTQAPGFSAEAAFDHVRRLAGRIGPRPAGSSAFRRAVRYVRGTLVALGYETGVPSFPLPQGGRSWNVVARWPGSGTDELLIGAHLDTVGGAPGANDNASGVAVLLEMARALAEAGGPPPGLALMAFGAEEFQPDGSHHLGSRSFVHRMDATERAALEVMVSADMVGKVHAFVVANLQGTTRRAARIVARTARGQGFGAGVRTLGDISDHGPFALAGIPAALLWTGDEPNRHQPTDVVRNVRRRALVRAGTVLLALIDDRL
jgi:peptidase M28-like protein